MKVSKFFAGIFFLSIFGFASVHAQTFKNTGSGLNQVVIDKEDTSEENESEDVVSKEAFSLENIEMEKENHSLRFTSLPTNLLLKVYVTDAKGNELVSKMIDSKNNAVDIRRLRKGVFFATVIDDVHELRKSFVVPAE
jgi:hypothetical protein